MARRQGQALDLQGYELLNPRAQNLGANPGSAGNGFFYFDTTAGAILWKTASGWVNPLDRTKHSGLQPSSSISDLASTVKSYRLDEFSAPISPVSLGGQRAINGATPTSPGDLATKNYVDNLLNGLDWKESARAATTVNINLSGPQTVDSVALIAGNRCLVKNQTVASQNGVYIVSAGGWTRAPDCDIGTLTSGASLMITEGGTNADTQWRLITDDPLSIGTTALSFTQIGAVISFTGTNGVVVTGNVISLDNAVAVRKYATTIGDGSTTSIAVTHGLGTDDIVPCVFALSDKSEVDVEVIHTSVNVATFIFAVAPPAASYRVVIHG